jgi:hypothetical protein
MHDQDYLPRKMTTTEDDHEDGEEGEDRNDHEKTSMSTKRLRRIEGEMR